MCVSHAPYYVRACVTTKKKEKDEEKRREEKVEPIKRSRETAVNRSDYGGFRIIQYILQCSLYCISVQPPCCTIVGIHKYR